MFVLGFYFAQSNRNLECFTFKNIKTIEADSVLVDSVDCANTRTESSTATHPAQPLRWSLTSWSAKLGKAWSPRALAPSLLKTGDRHCSEYQKVQTVHSTHWIVHFLYHSYVRIMILTGLIILFWLHSFFKVSYKGMICFTILQSRENTQEAVTLVTYQQLVNEVIKIQTVNNQPE